MDKKVDLIGKLIITYVFILALCFLLYALVVLPVNGAEKVNAIIGLLGWSATIYAPIAALFLIDNWKDQTKYNEQLAILASMIDEIMLTTSNIIAIRNDLKVAAHITHSYTTLKTKNLELLKTKKQIKIEFKSSVVENKYPDTNHLQQNIINLKKLCFQINLYSQGKVQEINIILNEVNKLDSLIKNFRSTISYFYIDNIFLQLLEKKDDNEIKKWYEKAVYINEYTYEVLKLMENITPSPRKKELENALENLLKEVKNYRELL